MVAGNVWFRELLSPPRRRWRRGACSPVARRRRVTVDATPGPLYRRASDGTEEVMPNLHCAQGEFPKLWKDYRTLFAMYTSTVQPDLHHEWVSPRHPVGGAVRLSWAVAGPCFVGGMVYLPDCGGFLFAGEPFTEIGSDEKDEGPDGDFPAAHWSATTYQSSRITGSDKMVWNLQVVSRTCDGAFPVKTPPKGRQRDTKLLLRLCRKKPDEALLEKVRQQRRASQQDRRIVPRAPCREPLESEEALRERKPFLYRRVIEQPLHVLEGAARLVRKGIADFGDMRLLYLGMHQLITRVRMAQRQARSWLAHRKVCYLRAKKEWTADEETRVAVLKADSAASMERGDKTNAFIARLEIMRVRAPADVKHSVISTVQSTRLRDHVKGEKSYEPGQVHAVTVPQLRHYAEQVLAWQPKLNAALDTENIVEELGLSPSDLEQISQQLAHRRSSRRRSSGWYSRSSLESRRRSSTSNRGSLPGGLIQVQVEGGAHSNAGGVRLRGRGKSFNSIRVVPGSNARGAPKTGFFGGKLKAEPSSPEALPPVKSGFFVSRLPDAGKAGTREGAPAPGPAHAQKRKVSVMFDAREPSSPFSGLPRVTSGFPARQPTGQDGLEVREPQPPAGLPQAPRRPSALGPTGTAPAQRRKSSWFGVGSKPDPPKEEGLKLSGVPVVMDHVPTGLARKQSMRERKGSMRRLSMPVITS